MLFGGLLYTTNIRGIYFIIFYYFCETNARHRRKSGEVTGKYRSTSNLVNCLRSVQEDGTY